MSNERPQMMFVGNREVREVPQDWEHPRDAQGRFVPLFPFGYSFDDAESAPTMPDPGATHEIMAYETVSEGTPISPAFPNTPDGRLELLRYCAEHCYTFGKNTADAEAWAAILFGDAAVALDGTVINEG
jgi:hypothetical protein